MLLLVAVERALGFGPVAVEQPASVSQRTAQVHLLEQPFLELVVSGQPAEVALERQPVEVVLTVLGGMWQRFQEPLAWAAANVAQRAVPLRPVDSIRT